VSAPTINPAALTAQAAITTAAIAWSQGRISGLNLLDIIATNRPTLDNADPGHTLAWPDTDLEPVAGLDYLPADVEDFDRNETALEITDGDHDGVDPTRSLDADWAPILAACPTSTAQGVEDAWVGWPNSVRRTVAA
jgi:hypothetical protein